jgi:hypothetical protein
VTLRSLMTQPTEFLTAGFARLTHHSGRNAALEGGDRRPSAGGAGRTGLYPATAAERREHFRMSGRRILATFAIVMAILVLFTLLASFRTH